MPQRTGKHRPKVRSRFEDKVINDLDSRKIEYDYEPSKGRVTYHVDRKYLPDVVLNNGIIVELKGWFKPADRTKHLNIKQQRPDLDVRFVFQRADNRLNKSSKTTYSEWCEKHGFKWSEGTIPQSWITEPRKANNH